MPNSNQCDIATSVTSSKEWKPRAPLLWSAQGFARFENVALRNLLDALIARGCDRLSTLGDPDAGREVTLAVEVRDVLDHEEIRLGFRVETKETEATLVVRVEEVGCALGWANADLSSAVEFAALWSDQPNVRAEFLDFDGGRWTLEVAYTPELLTTRAGCDWLLNDFGSFVEGTRFGLEHMVGDLPQAAFEASLEEVTKAEHHRSASVIPSIFGPRAMPFIVEGLNSSQVGS